MRLGYICNIKNSKRSHFFGRNVFKYLTRDLTLNLVFALTFPPVYMCVRVAPNLLRVSVSRGVWLDLSSDTTQLPSLWRVKIARPFQLSFHLSARFFMRSHEYALLHSLHSLRVLRRFAFFTIKESKLPPQSLPTPDGWSGSSSFVTQINNRCDLWLSFGTFIQSSTRARKRWR